MNTTQRTALVTGAAGFIGSHLCEALIEENYSVIGLDNFDDYYEKDQKTENLKHVRSRNQNTSSGTFEFYELDIQHREDLQSLITETNPSHIYHLAAKAGVRTSQKTPKPYIETNINGTSNLLEEARSSSVEQFIFVSSSSVYGESEEFPFSEDQTNLQPISLYGATKRATEIICEQYKNIADYSIVMIRPFTVYGPRQRPDMAIHKFTRKLLNEEPLPIYGDGTTIRDYTFVSDVVSGLVSAGDWSGEFGIFNLGGNKTTKLSQLVHELENATGKEATIDYQPLPEGDVPRTKANIDRAQKELHYSPDVSLEEGIEEFVEWFRNEEIRC